MKKAIKKIKKIDKKIKAATLELRITEDPLNAYYTKVATAIERKRDIHEINLELKGLLSARYASLETLQIRIEFEKAKLSSIERSLTIKISQS